MDSDTVKCFEQWKSSFDDVFRYICPMWRGFMV